MTPAHESIAGLLDAIATPLDRNDLGRLARMHSWGQQLMDTPADAPGAQTVRAVSTHLVLLLEKLILDELADPQRGIEVVPRAVQLLECAVRGEPTGGDALVDQICALLKADPATQPRTAAAPAAPQAAPLPVAAAAPAHLAPAAATADVACGPAPVAELPAVPAAGPTDAAAGPATGAADEPYRSEPLLLDLSEREHLDGFLEEAAEHMDAIEGGLLELEADPSDTAKINELFRPFHTIKGIAGFLNLRDINRLTHEIETLLDLGRRGELRITATTVDLIFSSVDALKLQLNAIRQYLADPPGGPCPQPDVADTIQRLRRAVQGGGHAEAPPPRRKLGEYLAADGVPSDAIAEALGAQAGENRKLGELLVDRGSATAGQVEQALAQQAAGKPVLDQSIRVDTRKLDILVDAVGELVIAQSMVSLTEGVTGDEKLHRNVAQVTKIVRDVQETAMAMRMVPIGHTFQKMRRLVRDVAKKAGKLVELTITGEETELDKNVIQQISDPLVHMVRNAVDHGIESPEERRRAGKPESGQVLLNAFHQGDSIVIEVRDDGKGLDPERLRAKGLERGLITAEDQLSKQQLFAMILQPGFSTAEKVTDISGRGVGMDVVKRNVEQLRGKIDIDSEPGRGSTFYIRLPLTLAIIDGMLVRVGCERMIIPTILIEQSLRPEARQITTVQRRGAMLQVRGELCPLIQLGPLFGYTPPIDPCENLVVIVQCEGQKIALVLDELIGQQQVVIKTLGQRFKKVEGVSGAAILGDGRVGLILEPTGLLKLHTERGAGVFQAAAAAAGGSTYELQAAGDPAEASPVPQETCPAELIAAPA